MLIRTCPVCGEDIVRGSAYCWKCGTQLSFAGPIHNASWYAPAQLRAPKPILSVTAISASGIALVASVVAAFAYHPSRSLFLCLIALFAKSEFTMKVLGTVATLVLSAGIFLAAVLVYFGYRIMGSMLSFIFAVASIITGGGFMAGLVLGMVGALLAAFGK